ncbi:MAG: hypothetical protein ACOH18_05045 [Candidatus Saccharimonadaceae bacterium]
MTKQQKRTSTKKLALWLLIAPASLIIFSFLLFALNNFIFSGITPSSATTIDCQDSAMSIKDLNDQTSCELPETTSRQPIQQFINYAAFIIGSIGTIALIPSFIAGIILLVIDKRQKIDPTE